MRFHGVTLHLSVSSFLLLTILLFSVPLQADGNSVTDRNASPTALQSAPAPEATDEFGDFGDEFGDISSSLEDEFDADAAQEELFDPLEGFNRSMTAFNNALFDYVLEPVVLPVYDFILPEPLRVVVNNFFNNLTYPVSLVNNLLQLKFEGAAIETGRFIVNSTFGFAGLFDPARDGLGLEPHREDLGQTLGYYGMDGVFPIVLPFFGPTNLRDFAGDLLDFYADPIYYVDIRQYNLVENVYQGWSLVVYKEFNEMSLYEEEYKSLRKDALDFYPYLRDAYEQRRNKLISE